MPEIKNSRNYRNIDAKKGVKKTGPSGGRGGDKPKKPKDSDLSPEAQERAEAARDAADAADPERESAAARSEAKAAKKAAKDAKRTAAQARKRAAVQAAAQAEANAAAEEPDEETAVLPTATAAVPAPAASPTLPKKKKQLTFDQVESGDDSGGEEQLQPPDHAGRVRTDSEGDGSRKKSHKELRKERHQRHGKIDSAGVSDGGSAQSKYKGKFSKKPTSAAEEALKKMGRSRGEKYEKNLKTGPEVKLECTAPIYDGLVFAGKLLDMARQPGKLGDLVSKTRGWGSSMAYPESYRGCVTAANDAATVAAGIGGLPNYLPPQCTRDADDLAICFAFGLQPSECQFVTLYPEKLEQRLTELVTTTPRCVAVGAIGLDYGIATTAEARAEQVNAFKWLLEFAVKRSMPVIVQFQGGTEAETQGIAVLEAVLPPGHKVLLHAFSGHCDDAMRFVAAFKNGYIGFNGRVTFAKALQTHNLGFDCPPDRLVLSSGAPGDPPAALGAGKKDFCHSGHLVLVAEKLAELRRSSSDEVLQLAADNYRRFFGIEKLESDHTIADGSPDPDDPAAATPVALAPASGLAVSGKAGDKQIAGLGTSTAENSRFYSDWASTYSDDVTKWGYDAPEQAAALLREVSSADNETGDVLDAGAGDGLSGLALQAAGFRSVVGVDISPKLLAIAEARGCYTKVYGADLSQPLPFESNTFAVVSCTGVMTYLAPDCGVLAEFVRVTRPGGLVQFTHRTDKMALWTVATRELVAAGAWEKVRVTDPLPYLPKHPEYGDKIKVVLSVYRVAADPTSDPAVEPAVAAADDAVLPAVRAGAYAVDDADDNDDEPMWAGHIVGDGTAGSADSSADTACGVGGVQPTALSAGAQAPAFIGAVRPRGRGRGGARGAGLG